MKLKYFQARTSNEFERYKNEGFTELKTEIDTVPATVVHKGYKWNKCSVLVKTLKGGERFLLALKCIIIIALSSFFGLLSASVRDDWQSMKKGRKIRAVYTLEDNKGPEPQKISNALQENKAISFPLSKPVTDELLANSEQSVSDHGGLKKKLVLEAKQDFEQEIDISADLRIITLANLQTTIKHAKIASIWLHNNFNEAKCDDEHIGNVVMQYDLMDNLYIKRLSSLQDDLMKNKLQLPEEEARLLKKFDKLIESTILQMIDSMNEITTSAKFEKIENGASNQAEVMAAHVFFKSKAEFEARRINRIMENVLDMKAQGLFNVSALSEQERQHLFSGGK